jgi:hypothetical protein
MNDLVSALKLNLQASPRLAPFKHLGPIRAVVIGMMNNHSSTIGTRAVLQSIRATQSDIDPFILDATIPSTVEHHLSAFNLKLKNWTYPKSPAEQWIDPRTGLRMSGYAANDWTKVVACMVSHMRAWQLAVDMDTALIVLEHDAKFTRRFKYSDIEAGFTGGIMGLNNPLGATRKSQVFYDKVLEQSVGSSTQVLDVPWVDNTNVPQGLAGNSAYIIKPQPAKLLLEKVADVGIWPNDALMCKQLFPWLQTAYPFYTSLQGIKSTTQG